MKKHKYNYFYKITNLINNHFYYGVHTTDNLEDGYMGSGKRLQCAYKKYGMENFKKEILKFFDSFNEAFEYESEVVNEELVNDYNCYNLVKGGFGKPRDSYDTILCKDKDGNRIVVSKNDPRYISKELVSWNKGMINVHDKDGNSIVIPTNDPLYKNGTYSTYQKGKIMMRDKNGKYYFVLKTDNRIKTGELFPTFVGRKHTEKTKEKMRLSHQKNHYQQGEKNSQFGTCWIHNEEKSIKIKKEDLSLYMENGWIKGRKIKFNASVAE